MEKVEEQNKTLEQQQQEGTEQKQEQQQEQQEEEVKQDISQVANQKSKQEKQEEYKKKQIEKQNEKQRVKNEKRLEHKQNMTKNERHLPEVWNMGEHQYKEKIREDLGNNKQGKPRMPVIFFKWSDKHEKKAHEVLDLDTQQLTEEEYNKFESTAHNQWDKFYKNHKLGFFHHRYYLRREFPELVSIKEEKRQKDKYVLTELGCGVGDTIYPLKLEYPNLMLQACDFSAKAVDWVIKSEEYDPTRVRAAVMDLVNDKFPKEFEASDLVTLIFCLSAISPENYPKVIKKIYDFMKPGAIIYYRDYGKYDFSQLNFSRKKGKKLKENFYVKHDGTRCYFAAEQEISKLFREAGFEEKECKAHNRYLENRKTGLEMYRVWIQGRFKKPGPEIFDHYGPIEFEELDMDVKDVKEIQRQAAEGGEIGEGEIKATEIKGKLDQKIIDKMEEKLKQNDKLLEEQQQEEERNTEGEQQIKPEEENKE